MADIALAILMVKKIYQWDSLNGKNLRILSLKLNELAFLHLFIHALFKHHY